MRALAYSTLPSTYFTPTHHKLLSPVLATSDTPDPHAVSNEEAQSYYVGLPSEPTLLYRTGKAWSPPRGPEAQRRQKELCEVFKHPIANLWNNGLCWDVVDALDDHKIFFTTIDVVRFKMVDVDEAHWDEDADEEEAKKPIVSPVTIWIGVFPGSTSATTAYNAAQAILSLLKDHQITDVDVDFRESFYTRKSSPQLLKPVDDLDPLIDVISPLTPTLGLPIFSMDIMPNSQGTMALYLAEGGDSDRLLGLTCRHVLFRPREHNIGYTCHPIIPTTDVLLLGKRAYTNLVDSIKLRIGRYGIAAERWKEQIKKLEKREKGTNDDDVRSAKEAQVKTQVLLDDVEEAMEVLGKLLVQVENEWSKLDNCVLGPILRCPAIGLGVDRNKLGDGFQGNKIDLGTKLTPDEFTVKCFARGDDNWRFKYPIDRLLPLQGIITDELMCKPDMWDLNFDPCLLVVKSSSSTGATLGRANGVFSIVREYFTGSMTVVGTSMEWGILNYDSKSDMFSGPGDSGSIIADIRGRIGSMLTGGSGKANSSDITYATPFWWLLQRIQADGFPNAHLNVVE
ncbi:hypothetical protein BDQ17DRAFT_1387976 [Cyathus striatus]|nr:hypothetical protein BDQ17DRAFT_1387976 [Cyathus striatus]